MAIPPAILPLRFKIPLAGYKFSTNKIYAGSHWGKRKSVKDGIASIAAVFCRPVARIESYPVEIRYRFCFVSRPLDTLNTAAMAKMLEDAFRSLGILEDDDPAHVARTVLEVDVFPRKKGSSSNDASSAQGDAPNEDQLEVTIIPYVR